MEIMKITPELVSRVRSRWHLLICIYFLIHSINVKSEKPWDCMGVDDGENVLEDGLKATCDKGGVVIQKRLAPMKLDFQSKTWKEHKWGFENSDGELWFGLERIRQLLSRHQYTLRIELTFNDSHVEMHGGRGYVEYRYFSIGPEKMLYQLHVGNATGTAGDPFFCMTDVEVGKVNGSKFMTQDHRKGCQYPRGQPGWWSCGCLGQSLNEDFSNPNRRRIAHYYDCQRQRSLHSTRMILYRQYKIERPELTQDCVGIKKGIVYLNAVKQKAWCLNGGLIVQYRERPFALQMNRSWQEYRNGFGSITSGNDYWFGLHNVKQVVGQMGGGYILRTEVLLSDKLTISADLTLLRDSWAWTEYHDFNIGDEVENYALEIGGGSGYPGDLLASCHYYDITTGRAVYKARFSTEDKGTGQECANKSMSGWWYSERKIDGACTNAGNLNLDLDSRFASGGPLSRRVYPGEDPRWNKLMFDLCIKKYGNIFKYSIQGIKATKISLIRKEPWNDRKERLGRIGRYAVVSGANRRQLHVQPQYTLLKVFCLMTVLGVFLLY